MNFELEDKLYELLESKKLDLAIAMAERKLKEIPTTDFHRAEEDASYCGYMFLEMIKRISVGGKPPQLENLISLTGKPEFKFPQIIRYPKQMGFSL